MVRFREVSIRCVTAADFMVDDGTGLQGPFFFFGRSHHFDKSINWLSAGYQSSKGHDCIHGVTRLGASNVVRSQFSDVFNRPSNSNLRGSSTVITIYDACGEEPSLVGHFRGQDHRRTNNHRVSRRQTELFDSR